MYHAVNRGSRKGVLFSNSEEYSAFERLLAQGREHHPVRIICYCLMPNHWHLLLWPQADGQLSKYLHWVTGTHAARWRRRSNTVGQGAVYQSRFRHVPVRDYVQLLATWRYIERNPVGGRLASRAELWEWSSAAHLIRTKPELRLDNGPIARPVDWLEIVNQEDTVPLMMVIDRSDR